MRRTPLRGRTFFAEPLEPRRLLSGVTVITHGWQLGGALPWVGGLPPWTVDMGRAILDRANGPGIDQSTGSLFRSVPTTGKWEEFDDDGIWQNSNKAEDEIVLLYDWSSESNDVEDGWLAAAADNLFASLLDRVPVDELRVAGPNTSFIDLARSPGNSQYLNLHFIGHSRGAVLNSLVTQRLGQYFGDQLRIDQVTSLDPHPWSFDLPLASNPESDPGYDASSPGDSTLTTYKNVVWADNYYRQDGIYEWDAIFDGVRAVGAQNVKLNNGVLIGSSILDPIPSDGGFVFEWQGAEHSDTRLWYAATINTADTSIDGTNIEAEEGAGWWTKGVGFSSNDESNNSRAGVGYAYSRIASASQRPTTNQTPRAGYGARVGVFNGDFTYGNGDLGTADQIPGWERHGGGGAGELVDNTLELSSPLRQGLTHNPFYLPPTTEFIEFDYRVGARSGKDALKVALDIDGVEYALGIIDLGTRGLTGLPAEDWVRGHRFNIERKYRGKVVKLKFGLTDSTLWDWVGSGSKVYIDNVEWVQGPASRSGVRADVVEVIDVSASMKDSADGSGGGGTKLSAAQAAGKLLIDLMQPGDRVGLVTFSDSAQTPFPLTIISAGPRTLFSDGLDALGGWVADPTWGVRSDNSRPRPYVTDSPNGNYANGADSSLTLRTAVILPPNEPSVLRFMTAYDLERNWDFGRIEISADDGPWVEVERLNDRNFSWNEVAVSLADFQGQSVRVRFRLTTDGSNTKEGWYLDDIRIETVDFDARATAKAEIDDLVTRGNTAIRTGIEAADAQLDRFPSSTRAMIVMTDGADFPTDTDPLGYISAEVDPDVRIFTVGFGPDVNEAVLRQIAAARNGEYYFAASSADLQRIYTTLVGTAAGQQQVMSRRLAISPRGEQATTVNIDPSISSVTIGLNWGGSDLDLELTAPDGTVFSESSLALGVERVEGPTYEFFRINSPATGQWLLKALGVDVPRENYPFDAYALADTAVTALAGMNKRTDYGPGERATVRVTLNDGVPIRAASVVATIRRPAGADQSLVLYDDGAHGDGAADDGVYADVYADTGVIGAYNVDVEVTANSNLGFSVNRVRTTSFNVSADAFPLVTIEDFAITEPAFGSIAPTMTVSLSKPADVDVTIAYQPVAEPRLSTGIRDVRALTCGRPVTEDIAHGSRQAQGSPAAAVRPGRRLERAVAPVLRRGQQGARRPPLRPVRRGTVRDVLR